MAGQEFTYSADGVDYAGYMAGNDTDSGKRPGVLVVHDWMGVSDVTREVCDKVADLGYVALAADIYGKDTRPTNRDEAGQAAGPYFEDRAALRKRVALAFDQLKNHESVDASKTGCVGYCFGGLTTLELARSGADVSGIAVFHGILATPTPDDAKNIKAKVLVMHGYDDPMVQPDQMNAFLQEMKASKADWQFVAYGNTMHAFTRSDANDADFGTVYESKADARSWISMKNFFEEVFA